MCHRNCRTHDKVYLIVNMCQGNCGKNQMLYFMVNMCHGNYGTHKKLYLIGNMCHGNCRTHKKVYLIGNMCHGNCGTHTMLYFMFNMHAYQPSGLLKLFKLHFMAYFYAALTQMTVIISLSAKKSNVSKPTNIFSNLIFNF